MSKRADNIICDVAINVDEKELNLSEMRQNMRIEFDPIIWNTESFINKCTCSNMPSIIELAKEYGNSEAKQMVEVIESCGRDRVLAIVDLRRCVENVRKFIIDQFVRHLELFHDCKEIPNRIRNAWNHIAGSNTDRMDAKDISNRIKRCEIKCEWYDSEQSITRFDEIGCDIRYIRCYYAEYAKFQENIEKLEMIIKRNAICLQRMHDVCGINYGLSCYVFDKNRSDRKKRIIKLFVAILLIAMAVVSYEVPGANDEKKMDLMIAGCAFAVAIADISFEWVSDPDHWTWNIAQWFGYAPAYPFVDTSETGKSTDKPKMEIAYKVLNEIEKRKPVLTYNSAIRV